MNSIELQSRIDFYNNLTSSARFTRQMYDIAVNDAMMEYIDEQFGDDDNADPKNFQWVQQIKDNLYTLIAATAPVVTPGVIITTPYSTVGTATFPNPADYKNLIYLQTTIGGITSYSRPTTFNEIGPLLQDSFKKPTNSKLYHIESSTGYTLYKGSTGTVTVVMLYLKIPATFTIGDESQVISPPTVLTNALVYYALETTVFNSVTYEMGDSITGNGVTALSSGRVILSTNTVTCSLPPETHEKIAKMSSQKMLKTISDYEGSMAIQSEADKS